MSGLAELTDGFRNRHDLCAVERQVTERPDDGMNLLHDVEGDGHDAARVLTNRHPSGGRSAAVKTKNERELRHCRRRRGLTRATSGWAQTG